MKVGEIDLKIPLTSSLIAPVKNWLAIFVQSEPTTSYHPFVNELDRTLNICSFAFPGFVSHIDLKDSTEFEVRRLRRIGEDAIRKVMARKRDALVIRNFEQTLELLK